MASFFCSQACFRGGWEAHKELHATALSVLAAALAREGSGRRAPRAPRSFDGYSFTGKLRPAAVSPRVRMPPGLPAPDYAEIGRSPTEEALRGSNVIPVFKGEEIEHLRRAGR